MNIVHKYRISALYSTVKACVCIYKYMKCMPMLRRSHAIRGLYVLFYLKACEPILLEKCMNEHPNYMIYVPFAFYIPSSLLQNTSIYVCG